MAALLRKRPRRKNESFVTSDFFIFNTRKASASVKLILLCFLDGGIATDLKFISFHLFLFLMPF